MSMDVARRESVAGRPRAGRRNPDASKKEEIRMMFRRALLHGALASCSLLAAGASARADYDFSTTSGGVIPFGTA
jgi:hypothetical protein